ncbi:hypothetical protein [Niallia sp. NCCP-28]|uniref:hypothetical protein n=1 Tax=Niallia sp. NCCP-28 TaxID=2934712 RepID=UPI00208B41FD|nr:hypothetical protein [Niallia sp. NCCP-28]GKU83919.1 hypothetical protein NCCP28_33150 [Niallia sp. NCCP-28]
MENFEPGKTISFRLPQNTPKSVSDHLNKRKKVLGRKFSSEIAPLFVEAIEEAVVENKINTCEMVEIPLPKGLTQDQKEWLDSPHTKSLLSQLIFQVVNQPGTPFPFPKPENVVEQAPKQNSDSVFKVDSKIQNFAKKTFLSFDDDDD